MLETGKKLTDSLVNILSTSFFNLRGNMKTLRSFFLSFILGISAWPTLAVEPVNKHQDEPQSRIDTNGLPTFTSKLSQPIPFPGSRFGAAVSVSLDTAAVGAPGFSPTQANQGGVYIFARQNGNWTLTQTITPLDATANSQFGCSVSLNGDTLVIGARGDATTQAGQGAAYI